MTIIVLTTKAPAAIGPYSQAIKAGNLLFTSGQIPIDPATGKLAGETTFPLLIGPMRSSLRPEGTLPVRALK